MKHSHDLSYIRQLCCLGLGGQAIMPALLDALHKILPSYANVFLYADDDCQLTSLYAEAPVPLNVIQRYLAKFYNPRVLEVRPRLDALKAGTGVDHTRAVYVREYYDPESRNLIHRSCGLHRVLNGMVHEGGQTLGAVLLYRAPGDCLFVKSEEDLLTFLLPYIAHAFAKRDFGGGFVDSGERGLIILNQLGKVLFMCPQGRRLLFLSTHPKIAPHTVARKDNYTIPGALLCLIGNARAVVMDQTAAPPVAHLENPWGRFVFRAHWLEQNDCSGNALIGVCVHRQEPLPLKLMRTMQSLPLSATQREVCLLLSERLTHATIARRLRVSPSTAIDHVRKIYDKLDVHSHEQLMQKLLGEPDPRHTLAESSIAVGVAHCL